MMKPELRIGLLGAGYILASHAKALGATPGVAIHAVCDMARGRAEAAARAHGAPLVLDSIEALAASDCDAVHILLPPHLHIPAARTLLAAGKAVFLEKPMGVTAAECDDLAGLAEARGLRLGVNHNFLFLPAYQAIRDDVRAGALGPIDHLAVSWLSDLALLRFGPFNNWMVAEPGNLMFELGPHPAAFVVDLLGPMAVEAAVAGRPMDLPGDQRAWRHWTAIGSAGRASVTLALSVAPGAAHRQLTLRGLAGVVHFDFQRGVAWREGTTSANPIVDNFAVSRQAARAIAGSGRRDFARYFRRTLGKAAAANPFEESILESVRAFYAGWDGPVDPRQSARFGAEVIRLCEAIVARAGITVAAKAASGPAPAPTKPRVLVVGGTGFIGRRLVERLAAAHVGVRVLTRSLGSARIDLAGLDVELMQGSHGEPAVLDRALAGIDTVYHLAKADGQNWDDYLGADIAPTRTLAEAALAHGVRRFIYTGTIDSHASADAKTTITSDTPLDPAIASRNLYARSKAACEALLREMAGTRGLPLVIFRPGVVIGAGSPPAHWGVGRFVSDTRVDYWGDGTNPLPLVLVDDVADALALALDAAGIEGETFLLTDAPLLSARDYVAAVAARSGYRIEARPRATWRNFAEDVLKEGAKHAIRHRNRRAPSYHDWDCRSHRARYDAAKSRERLGWRPAGTREALTRGIDASVDGFMT